MNGLHELLSTGLMYKLGWTLIHSLWQGVAVAGVFGLALLILPRAWARARYAAGCLSLLTAFAACVATFAIITPPAMPMPPSPMVHEPATVEHAPLAELTPIPPAAVVMVEPSATVPVVLDIRPEARGQWLDRLRGMAGAKLTPLLPWLAGAWLAGVLGLSIWRCGGLVATYRLRRLATAAVTEDIRGLVVRLSERIRVSRPIRILQSAVIATPAVIGHVRPVILLPVAAVTGLSPRELEAIIAHELAHIRRYDYLANIVQTVVETLLFHHPAIWWISSRIRAERENCCDDIALALCGDRLTYARALAQVEQLGTGNCGLAAAASGGSLLARIRRIVELSNARRGSIFAGWAPGVLTIVLVVACALGVRMNVVGANEFSTQEEVGSSDDDGKPAMSPPAVEGRMRHYVKLTAGKERVVFQGQESNWDDLPDLMARVPDRANTVLEFSHLPDETTKNVSIHQVRSVITDLTHNRERAKALAEQYGFEMFNDSPDPGGSKGTPSQFVPYAPKSLATGPWGGTVEQVQCRLRADRTVWREDETPWLWASIRHHRDGKVVVAPGENVDGLIVDGVWYSCWWGEGRPHQNLAPDTPSRDYLYLMGQNWRRMIVSEPPAWRRMLFGKPQPPSFSKGGWRYGERLQLGPGRHTVSVVIEVSDRMAFRNGQTIQVISNPVEIEIVPVVPVKPNSPATRPAASRASAEPSRAADASVTRILPLKYFECAEIARVVKQFLDPGSATTHPSTNSLIVSAPEEVLNQIAYLVAQLDRPSPLFKLPEDNIEKVVRVAKLEHGRSALVAGTINRIYRPRSLYDDPRVDIAEAVTAQAMDDDQLVLGYPPTKEAEILALVKLLDAPDLPERQILRVFAVENPAELVKQREIVADSGFASRIVVARSAHVIQADVTGIEKIADLLEDFRAATTPGLDGARGTLPSGTGIEGAIRLPDGSPATRPDSGTRRLSENSGPRISGVVRDATSQAQFDEDFLRSLNEVKSDADFSKLAHERPRFVARSKVTVHLLGQTAGHEKIAREAVTDEQGQYTFRGLAEGDYEVWAEFPSGPAEPGADTRRAFGRATIRISSYPGPNAYEDGRVPVYSADLNLRSDLTTVRGRVTDAQGTPVGGAIVTCTDQFDRDDQRSETSEGDRFIERRTTSAMTGPDGRYELRGIEPPDMYFAAAYLNGGPGWRHVKRLIEVRAAGYRHTNRSVPLVTEELRRKSRRLLAVLRGLEERGRQSRPTTKPAQIVGEKPGVPLPHSSGNVITGEDFILQPATPSTRPGGNR